MFCILLYIFWSYTESSSALHSGKMAFIVTRPFLWYEMMPEARKQSVDTTSGTTVTSTTSTSVDTKGDLVMVMHDKRKHTIKGGRERVQETREKGREEMEKMLLCVQTPSYTINKSQEVCSFPIWLNSLENSGSVFCVYWCGCEQAVRYLLGFPI